MDYIWLYLLGFVSKSSTFLRPSSHRKMSGQSGNIHVQMANAKRTLLFGCLHEVWVLQDLRLWYVQFCEALFQTSEPSVFDDSVIYVKGSINEERLFRYRNTAPLVFTSLFDKGIKFIGISFIFYYCSLMRPQNFSAVNENTMWILQERPETCFFVEHKFYYQSTELKTKWGNNEIDKTGSTFPQQSSLVFGNTALRKS